MKISDHIHATEDLVDSIKKLRAIVEEMPYGYDRAQIESRVFFMEQLASHIKKNSEEIYDGIVFFAVEVYR